MYFRETMGKRFSLEEKKGGWWITVGWTCGAGSAHGVVNYDKILMLNLECSSSSSVLKVE